MRPPLKWAGGKYSVLKWIRPRLPAGKVLFEPFVGSAVVSMNVDYPHYRLSDLNRDLVSFYQHLQAEGRQFVETCREWFTDEGNTRQAYEDLRRRFNESTNARERASLLLYLNRHAYNGLYRVNSRGIFNVPHGRYKRPMFPEAAMMAFHDRAQRAQISLRPFDEAMAEAGDGDVVYCDPPYVPLSATADFTAYTRAGFGLEDQQRLADCARAAASRGATVVISNHATETTRELYAGARLVQFEVRRLISRDGANRGRAPELLAIFEPA